MSRWRHAILVAIVLMPVVAFASFEASSMREKYVVGANWQLLGYAGVEARNVDGLAGDEILIASPAMWQLLRWDAGAGTFAQLGFFESGYGGVFYGGGLAEVHFADLLPGGPLQIAAMTSGGDIVAFNLDGSRRDGVWKAPVPEARRMIVGNVDGVAGDEVVFETCSEVSAWKFGAKTPLWTVKTDGCQNLLLAQLDRDPQLELALGHGMVLDATTGRTKWRYPLGFGEILAAGDVDGDGVQELIGATGRQIDVFNVEQHTTMLETFLDYPSAVGALSAADVDADGRAEIFAFEGTGAVRKLDGMTGTVLQQISKSIGINFGVIADLTGGCSRALVWGEEGGSTAVDAFHLTDAQTMTTFWSNVRAEMGSSGIAVADFAGTQHPSVLWSSRGGTVHVFAGFNPRMQKGFDRGEGADPNAFYLPVAAAGRFGSTPAAEYASPSSKTHTIVNVYNGATDQLDWSVQVAPIGDTISSMAAGDLNRDGRDDLVVGTSITYFPVSHPESVVAIDGLTHKVLWRTSENIAPLWDASCLGCIVEVKVADLALDGTRQVVALVPYYGLYAFHAATGRTLWTSSLSVADSSVNNKPLAFSIADVDPSPGAEIIVALPSGRVGVADKNGHLLRSASISKYGDAWAVEAADLDGDGEKEIIVTTDSRLVILSADKLEVLWDAGVILSGFSRGNQIAVTDLDGDGTTEIVVPSAHSLRVFEYRKPAIDAVPPTFDGHGIRVVPSNGCCLVEMTWDAASDAASMPVKYRVYRGARADFEPSPLQRLGETSERSFVDRSTLVAGETAYYVVTAVDAAGNESADSLRISPVAPSGCPSRRRAAQSR